VSGARQLSAIIRADCSGAEHNDFHELGAAVSPMPTRGAIMYKKRASDVPPRRLSPGHEYQALTVSERSANIFA
jgi:hypothetical protein